MPFNHPPKKLYGLIGYPISHSFSKQYFSEKFDRENLKECEYRLFPLPNIDEFPALIAQYPNLCGLNVTLPHKQDIMLFLDEIDPQAQAVGAVNCIAIRPEKRTTCGYNTDIYGFAQSLRPLLKPHHQKALILGTGGAAKAVQYVLQQSGITYLNVSRQPSSHASGTIGYGRIDKTIIAEHALIINTTPVGMSPNAQYCPPLPYQFITQNHLCYDLIYNPQITLFLQKSALQNAVIKNGLEMLYLQAEKSHEIWLEYE